MADENAAKPALPKWVTEKVLPTVGSRVRSVEMTSKKCAVVFAETGCFFAWKPMFGGPKIDRVDYPKGLFLNESNCPHCGKPIVEPVGKIARLASEAPAKQESEPKDEPKQEISEKQKEVLAYARDMKELRKRAAKAPGGKGPIKARPSAKKLKKAHGLK